MKIRVGGVWRDIVGAKVFQAGSWRTLAAVKIYSGAAWRSAGTFSPTGTSGGMTLEISPSSGPTTVSGSGAALSTVMVGTPRNGHRPYTYVWSVLSESGPGSIAIATPTLASTNITANFSGVGTITATLQCIATDRTGDTASGTIDLTFIRTA